MSPSLAFATTGMGLAVATTPRSAIPVLLACAAKKTDRTARTAADESGVTGADLVVPEGASQ